MKAEATATRRGRGGVRPPRGPAGSWSYWFDLGLQPAQRCEGCNRRVWVGHERLTACPTCGAAMRDTNERRSVEKAGFATRGDAVQARADELAKLGRGDYRPPSRMTVAAYLRDVWLPAIEHDGLKSTTIEAYEGHVKHHLIGPASKPFRLGTTQLRRLSLDTIRDHYEMLAQGYEQEVVTKAGKTRMVTRPGLAAGSIRRVHATVHRALNVAIEKRLLDRNPARGAGRKLPAAAQERERVVRFWEPAELQRFLSFTRDQSDGREAFYALWYVLAHTGMRRGEAAGLMWSDLDLEEKTLTVRRARVPLRSGTVEETTTKTKRQRSIDLDDGTVAVLKRQKRAQASARLAAGPKWSDTGYVFTDDHGEPLHPEVVSWQFRAAVDLANRDAKDPATPKARELSPLSVHGLRHTHATIALQAGIPVTVVSKRLGHATVTMTLNVYSHALRGAQADLAKVFASVVQKGSF